MATQCLGWTLRRTFSAPNISSIARWTSGTELALPAISTWSPPSPHPRAGGSHPPPPGVVAAARGGPRAGRGLGGGGGRAAGRDAFDPAPRPGLSRRFARVRAEARRPGDARWAPRLSEPVLRVL